MCGTCDTADALAVVARARRVADALAAELLHEPVAKAMAKPTATMMNASIGR